MKYTDIPNPGWKNNIIMNLKEMLCEDVTGFIWLRTRSTDGHL
jgi:hypothetical protein